MIIKKVEIPHPEDVTIPHAFIYFYRNKEYESHN